MFYAIHKTHLLLALN